MKTVLCTLDKLINAYKARQIKVNFIILFKIKISHFSNQWYVLLLKCYKKIKRKNETREATWVFQ